MVAGIIGRLCALVIIEPVEHGRASHRELMSEMAAACIASVGDSLWDGSAATILIYTVVPDPVRFPDGGRDPFVTHMEMGLAGAWMKRVIHSTFCTSCRDSRAGASSGSRRDCEEHCARSLLDELSALPSAAPCPAEHENPDGRGPLETRLRRPLISQGDVPLAVCGTGSPLPTSALWSIPRTVHTRS
jgi:hypothetical protein